MRVNLLHAHGSPSGHMYKRHRCRCVACRAAEAERHHKYESEHPGEAAAYSRKYRAEHPECVERHRKYESEHAEERAEYKRKYRAEHPATSRPSITSTRAIRLLKKYGLDIAEWEERFARQGDRCGCCGGDDPGSKHGWATDHDHKTGKFRGVLCHGCNTGLGGFRDDPERLMAAIEYLVAVEA